MRRIGKARAVELAEDAEDIVRNVLVHDQPARSNPSVEATVRHGQQTEVPQRHRTPRPPRDAGHPGRLRRVDPLDRPAEPNQPL
jgi:hypothetical protein